MKRLFTGILAAAAATTLLSGLAASATAASAKPSPAKANPVVKPLKPNSVLVWVDGPTTSLRFTTCQRDGGIEHFPTADGVRFEFNLICTQDTPDPRLAKVSVSLYDSVDRADWRYDNLYEEWPNDAYVSVASDGSTVASAWRTERYPYTVLSYQQLQAKNGKPIKPAKPTK